jgi:hypothetical protein
MIKLPCASKFGVFEPKEEYRTVCPFMLIMALGEHPHPVPSLTKIPPIDKIRAQIFGLLENLAKDLADITPRQFIRHMHPIVQSFLRSKFSILVSLTPADWHVSLSNRSHIDSYIKQALETFCPFGTGWAGQLLIWTFSPSLTLILEGVVNQKAQQDINLPKEKHYTRIVYSAFLSEDSDA